MNIMLVFLGLLVLLIIMGFKVLPEYERAVIFRFGRLARGIVGGNGPGVVIIIVMVNLLKFKPDGGAEAYGRYAQAVGPLLAKVHLTISK